MNKHERAGSMISDYKNKFFFEGCWDEVIQQIIFDLRAYADLHKVDFATLLQKSETSFKGFGT